jgi:hypothetical protein
MAERVHHRETCKSSYSLALPRSILFLSAFRPESAWCQNDRKVAARSVIEPESELVRPVGSQE